MREKIEKLAETFGAVEFEGKTYTLTSDAQPTCRPLPLCDYADVEEGKEFEFEMSANALDNKGNKYEVYWIFTDIKGENEKESYDMFDYDIVNRVEEA